MALPPVAIVMRSKNDADRIGHTLAAVRSQDYPAPVRRIHIDSGSTDGTCRIIEESGPDEFIQIRPEEYVPGRVLNMGTKRTSEPWIVFLNSDATPVDRNWLANLVRAGLSHPRAGAVYGRQVPRPDCSAVYAHDYDRCFGPARESKDWLHFFSMASSAVKSICWAQQPFREDLRYSEDDEWSRRIKEHGWEIVYAEDSVVMHSHNYTIPEVRRRFYGEGVADAANLSSRTPRDYGFLRYVVLAGLRDAVKDLGYCAARGRLTEWPFAAAVRFSQRAGKRSGFLDGCKRYRKPA